MSVPTNEQLLAVFQNLHTSTGDAQPNADALRVVLEELMEEILTDVLPPTSKKK